MMKGLERGRCGGFLDHCTSRVSLESARASRTGDGVLAIANFYSRALWRGATMSTRRPRAAPQKTQRRSLIVINRALGIPA